MVTSLALDRHIHVTVNRRFDDRVRGSYSSMELVDDFEDLEHELVREAMRRTGVTSGVEITTIADIPSRGTGLGSSSAVTVGLLNALHRFAGRVASPEQLADEARGMLESGDLGALGALIGDAWDSKRGISQGVSSGEIDALHDRIMTMGATGAKLLGAGGGGFFLVHGEGGLRDRLAELGLENRLIPLDVDGEGSVIIQEE